MQPQASVLTFRLGMSARDFFRENGRDPAPHVRPETPDDGIFAFTAPAAGSDTPGGFALGYSDGGCQATLPAGRYVQFDHDAGFLINGSATLPLETLPFDGAMRLAREIADGFDAAGWARKRYDLDRITEEGFGAASVGERFEYAGVWALCDRPDLSASLTIKDVDSLPTAPMVPLVPGRPDEPQEDARYILQVLFQMDEFDLSDEASALRDARRRAVAGSELDPVPLRLWLDDPAWRPEGWTGSWIP